MSFLSVTGLVMVIGSLAMSARAQGDTVYAAEFNQTTNRFGSIDLVSGNLTRISSIGRALINDVAYCPTNGQIYAISNSAVLITFNKTNGAITRVANLSASGIQSLAFRPSDGALFGATQTRLYTINPVNGTATSVGNFGSPRNLNNQGQNIRFAQDGNLYVSNTSTNTDIYRINTSNGSATWMGEAIGYPYLMLQNAGSNMYSVFINLGSATNEPPKLVTFDLNSFVVGGTNANGSTHQITVKLVGAGTNFPPNFTFSGGASQPITNLTIPVSAVGPVSQTVCAGDSAVFSTVASGTPPYSYAWLKNSSTLSGQTNSSLTLANVTASDAATYSVIVIGMIGKVTNSATLTVNEPVTVNAAPVDQTSLVGGSATFSVTATGTGLSYQWLFGGSVIGTGSSLALNNLTTGQAGVYTVIVNGTCSSATNSATLTVTKAGATVTLGSLRQTYDGSAKAATATTTPSGLALTYTYDGSATVPTVAGSYTVVATISDANYQGSATSTLVIEKATSTIALGDLSQTYGGTAKAATATTTPSGLAVSYTYNGSATVPTDAGSYTVIATIDDANYQGSATSALVIEKAVLTITADNKSKFCGQGNPTLTASYCGFVNGENAGVLTSAVALSTTATADSAIGQYPITASGAAAANYTINYVSGTLSVKAVPQLRGESAKVNGNNQFIVSWGTISGYTYQLEYTDDLASDNWKALGNPVDGNDAMVYVTNSISGTVQRYFRVGVQ